MSVNKRNPDGTLTPLASLGIGKLVPSISLVLTGTISLPEQAAHSQSNMTIHLPQRMPDPDYEVFFEQTLGNQGYRILTVHGKSIDTFALTSFNADVGVADATSVSYKVVKLMTDESQALDEAAIAQNTANFASAFSESTSYAVGDYVTYNNVLYKCTTAHTAGAWVSGNFTQVTVGDELGSSSSSGSTPCTGYFSLIVSEESSASITWAQLDSMLGGAISTASLSNGAVIDVKFTNYQASSLAGTYTYYARWLKSSGSWSTSSWGSGNAPCSIASTGLTFENSSSSNTRIYSGEITVYPQSLII